MSNYLEIPELPLGCLPLSILDSHLNAPPNDAQSFLGNQSPSGSPDCLPTALCVFNCDEARGRWFLQTDRAIISQKKYLYVSYCKADFTDLNDLEYAAKDACSRLHMDAYWIDYACMGDKPDDKLESLCRMRDVIRGATKTLILIGGGYACPRTPQWLNWGRRLWTLPELILSRDIVLFRLGRGLTMDSMRICKMIYEWESQDLETKLVYFYLEGGEGVLLSVIRFDELVEALINVIWKKGHSSESLTDLPEEKTYVLMSILPHRIEKLVGAELAFRSLMKENKLPEEMFPYPLETTDIYKESEPLKSFIIPAQFFFDTPDMFYPIKIVFRDDSNDKWGASYTRQLAGEPYLAISYRQEPRRMPVPEILEMEIQHTTWLYFDFEAYWYDYSCMCGVDFPSSMDLYHMADVYLRAKTTLILLPSEAKDGSFKETLIWSEWGRCVWSLVEALLSSELYYRIRGRDKEPISKRQVFRKAYGNNSRDMLLVDIMEGKVSLSIQDVLAHLMDSIWRKIDTISGRLLVSDTSTEIQGKLALSCFKAERVYALMMFMPVRIFPSTHETEYEALSRLLAANGIRSVVFRERLSKWCNEYIPGETHLCHLY